MSNVRDFGAVGDGLADDTQAFEHALVQGDGELKLPPGKYLLSRPLRVDLKKHGRFSVQGTSGTATILMAGGGPAFHIFGSIEQTADPAHIPEAVWNRERMPTALNVEIEGRHPLACGFWLEGVMQPTFEGVLLRRLLHGIRVFRRARNVLISHCHIYDNKGVGIFLDHVNLHQTIITGSHISYCKGGGIKIEGSEIRNLQITGNDIEYNYDLEAKASADIWIDSTADDSSVREGTIVGNTIQAKYSPGGANIRILGHNPEKNHKAGMFSISGNLIGSQEVNVHLHSCRGVVLEGNVIYSGHRRNLLIEGSRNIVVAANSFDHNPDYDAAELCTGVRIVESRDIVMNGLLLHDCQTGRHTVKEVIPLERSGLLEIIRSLRVNISGCEILDGTPYGLYLEDCSEVHLNGTSILEGREKRLSKASLRWKGTGKGNMIVGCRLALGTDHATEIDPTTQVSQWGNLTD